MRREAAAAEAERERRAAPEIELSANAIWTSVNEPPGRIVLEVGLSNEHGTRPVDRLTVSLFMPDFLDPGPCGNRAGDGPGTGGIRNEPNAEIGNHRGARVWFDTIGPIDPHVHLERFVVLARPRPGMHRIEAKLVHRDLAAGMSSHAWTLKVPQSGSEVELELTSVGSPSPPDEQPA